MSLAQLNRLASPAGPLRSFRERNYRLLWVSDAAVRAAEQMQMLVLAWYVVTETGSPLLVGIFGALRYTGTLFGAPYGVIVDRVNRRILLFSVRSMFTMVAGTTFVLMATETLEIWHVFLLTAIYGMLRAMDTITRQTVLGDVVRREDLVNALALMRTGQDAGQFIGPLIAGALLSGFGMSEAFAATTMVVAGASAATFLLRLERMRVSEGTASVWRTLAEGGGYIRSHDAVLALILFAFLVNLAGFPLTAGILPVFARDVLHTGPFGLAVLSSAAAAGAFVGSLALASVRGFARPGVLAVLSTLCWLGALTVFSASHWFVISLVVLLASGCSQSFSLVSIDSLLLRLTPAEFRGRIMGVRSMAVYGLPLGLLGIGAMADFMGAPAALALSTAVGAALAVLITVWLRELWGLRR